MANDPIQDLREEVEAQKAVLASLANRFILQAQDKHGMLEEVFTQALHQVDGWEPYDEDTRHRIKQRVRALGDQVQHSELE